MVDSDTFKPTALYSEIYRSVMFYNHINFAS